MKLDWSNAAQADLREIHHYWKCRASPIVADEIVDSIIASASRLCDFPELGYELDDMRYPRARELVHAPFRIRYRIWLEAVEVITVIHGARAG